MSYSAEPPPHDIDSICTHRIPGSCLTYLSRALRCKVCPVQNTLLLLHYWHLNIAGDWSQVDLAPREDTHRPAEQTLAQPAQPVNPPLVAPSHSGAHIQNVTPSLQAAKYVPSQIRFFDFTID